MAIIDPLLGIRLIVIFGITNVITFLMIASTCRCVVGVRFVNDMMKQDWYKWFFSHHCWYWRMFFLSVIIHIALVLMVFGIPF